MIQLRHASDRGHANHGWLDSWHSFSFADYYDPEHMGFSALRVINDDRIAPGSGFPSHGHADMEILTYVLEGRLAHRDSMGNGETIGAGEVQRMSAGSGIRHSEFNASETDAVHLLQIWIEPKQRGIVPSYEQKTFPAEQKRGRLCIVASPDGEDGSLVINQDARLYATVLGPEEALPYTPPPGRSTYLHVAKGSMEVNGIRLEAGDAAKARNEPLRLLGLAAGTEALLFDLP